MWKRKTSVFVILLQSVLVLIVMLSCRASAQDHEHILFLNARLYAEGEISIENSAVVVEDGILTLLADARNIRLNLDHYTKVIEAEGLHLYFIEVSAFKGETKKTSFQTEGNMLCRHLKEVNLEAHKTSQKIGQQGLFVLTDQPVADQSAVVRFIYADKNLHECF